MTELENSIKVLTEHTQHYVPTEDLEHLYAVIEAAEKVSKYETAKEDGRLVMLPCKVGDLVFKIFSQRDSFDDLEYDIITATNFNYTMIPEIGKTVFLTYKEAEKALKDRQEKPIALSSKIILDKQ